MRTLASIQERDLQIGAPPPEMRRFSCSARAIAYVRSEIVYIAPLPAPSGPLRFSAACRLEQLAG